MRVVSRRYKMSAFRTFPTHEFIIPPEGYTRNYPPHQYGLVPVNPYYYHECYIERSQESRWPVRRSPFHPFSPTNKQKVCKEFDREYEKPSRSYVELIASAILESPENKLVLGDIYEAISKKYPYFSTKGNGWRNSIRHNLSLSDCFTKGLRSANGKGHLWEVNLDCYSDTVHGKPSRYRKRSVKAKAENSYNYETPCEDTKNITFPTSPREQKLSLETLLTFDDEIREFEIARKKLNGTTELDSQNTLRNELLN
ncbi:hypothetical protein QZH41_004343 [Actinostola sp. cb2023]|nr:hypothetical protein QZH41_004343 [Actinostola sp. cb2023]